VLTRDTFLARVGLIPLFAQRAELLISSNELSISQLLLNFCALLCSEQD